MADSGMDATRIRELLLDFYGEHDPQRLNMGLDIFSMVVWTQQNGLASLNDLLVEQYGATIDPSKQLGDAQASFKRFSALMNTDSQDETQKRNKIYEKLLEFYEERDPSKIGRLNDFVQYIMLHGIDAFNRKLVAKYGEGISLGNMSALDNARYQENAGGFDRQSLGSSFTISTVETSSYVTAMSGGSSGSSGSERSAVEKKKKKNRSVRHKHAPARPAPQDEQDDFEEMPPPPPPAAAESGDVMESESKRDSREERLRAKLEDYYAQHDKAKLGHIESVVDWGMQIGEQELEGKLMQIYGVGFDSGAKPAAPPATPPPRPAGKTGPRPLPKAPASPKARHNFATNKPTKNKGPLAIVKEQAGFSRNSKGRPNTAARKNASPDDGPCAFYELDMSGSSFGVCRCGYSRLAHMKGSPENRKATERAQKQARALTSEMRASKFHPQRGQTNHVGTYMYKTTADTKGPIKVDVRAGGGEKGGDQPCGRFTLDMTAGTYAVCECGFKRDQHGKFTRRESGVKGTIKRLSQRLLSS